MNNETVKILLVEDNPDDALLVRRMLTNVVSADFELTVVDRLSEGIRLTSQRYFNVILLDLALPDSTGLNTFVKMNSATHHTPIIVLSGRGDEEMAIKAVQDGAQDYLVKGHIDGDLLMRSIRYAVERKKFEVALRESEEKYRTLIENVNTGIYRNTGGPEGRFLQANPAIANMFGYRSVDEFMKIKISDLYQNKEDRALYVNEVLQKGFMKNSELRLKKKDGSPIWGLCSANATFDDEGNLLWMDGVMNDITERKLEEEALRRREREAALLSEASRIFNTSLEIKEVVSEIAKIVSEEIGEACTIFKVGKNHLLPIINYHKGEESKNRLQILADNPVPLKGSITGYSVEKKEPILISDTDSDERLIKYSAQVLNISSYICVPIITKGEVHAVLTVSMISKDRRFDVNDLKLVVALAERAALALENSDMYDKERAQAKRQSVVNEMSRAATSSLNMESIYDTIVEQLKQILPFQFNSNIALYNHEDDTFVFSHIYDERGEFEKILKPNVPYTSDSLTLTKAFETKKTQYIKDVSIRPTEIQKQLSTKGYLSVLNLPLIIETRCIGTLNIGASHIDAFSEEEITLLETISSHLAIAINNAKILEELQMEIEERKRAETEMRESERQLRSLTARLAEVEVTERQMLSRELHDRVGQNLAALNINLKIIDNQLSTESKNQVESRLDDSMYLVEETTEHIRDVMADLRPEMLDEHGLTTALYWYCEKFSVRTGIAAEFLEVKPISRLPAIIESVLYRIALEAMNNVFKHSNANKVVINLEDEEGLSRLTIVDDGVGFDSSNLSSFPMRGWGLVTMKERARALGGHVRIRSVLGEGTQVTAEMKR